MADNKQNINGDCNIQIGSAFNVTIIVDKDNKKVLQFPGVEVRPEVKRQLLRNNLITFIIDKLNEIQRSEEWLKVMVYRDLGLVYQDMRQLDDHRLFELCSYLDAFYLEKN